jgi:hypothetical protein
MESIRRCPKPRNENDWPAVEQSGACEDMTNEISIEIDGNTITGSFEVNRGMIMVTGGILGRKSTPLGGPETTELVARRLLRQLYAESRRPQTI